MKVLIKDLKPHPFNKIFGDLPEDEFKALEKDIKERGMQTRIDITEDNVIVCGHQRIKALKKVGIEDVEARVLMGWDDSKIKEHLIKDNILRRQLTPIQIAKAGAELEKIYEGRWGVRLDSSVRTDSHSVGRTTDLVAKDFGLKGRTYENYRKAQEIVKEKGDDKLTELWQTNKISAQGIIRDVKIEEQREAIKGGLNEVSGKYDVIVIDPPWKYDTKYAPDYYMTRVANPYPEMGMDELIALKLPAKDDCILWLWTTNQFMGYAYVLLQEWGFEPKTILTWDKQTLGIGYYLRNVTEHCILAIKGKPLWTNKTYTTLISEKKTTHSTKPESFYKMVDEICVGRKLDYFARKKRAGWDVYGDETKEKKM